MSFIQQFFTSRDNNANAETFVGQEGRLWWDPVTNQIYSSDGSTPGGIPLAGGGGGNGAPAGGGAGGGGAVIGAEGKPEVKERTWKNLRTKPTRNLLDSFEPDGPGCIKLLNEHGQRSR